MGCFAPGGTGGAARARVSVYVGTISRGSGHSTPETVVYMDVRPPRWDQFLPERQVRRSGVEAAPRGTREPLL